MGGEDAITVTSGSEEINDAAFRTRTRRWLAHTSEFVAPVLRAGAALASRGRPTEPKTWRRGLIVGHNHIGDVLYRTCSLQQLHEGLPDCKWSYLASPASAELLEGNRAVAEVLPWNTGENSWNLEQGKFAELRRREFDVILCTNTLRHYPDLALGVGLGVPNRVAFGHKGLSGLITRLAPIQFPSPYAAYFKSMVADLTGRKADWPLRPKVYCSAEDEAAASRAQAALEIPDDAAWIVCSLTTRQVAGNWPREHLLSALEIARAKADFDVVLTGSSADLHDLTTVARDLSLPVKILAGGLGLRAYVAFLARCSALLTLDSGPRHLGNAAGIPVLFARNLSHSKIEAGQYCATEMDLAPDVEYLSDAQAMSVVATIPVEQTARRLVDALAASQPERALSI